MNKKTIYGLVTVVLIVIIVAGVAAAVLLNGNKATTGKSVTPTPTATPAPTPAPTGVVGASTLQFGVSETTGTVTNNYQYAMEGLKWNGNTPDFSSAVIRIYIISPASGNYLYILNVPENASYTSADNGGTWLQSNFANDWHSWSPLFSDYIGGLVNWNGSDATYTYVASSGHTIVISSISVNPKLPSSLFSTS
jgi:hypothetical protein